MEFDELVSHFDDFLELLRSEDYRLFAAAVQRLRERCDEAREIYSHQGPMTNRIADLIDQEMESEPPRRGEYCKCEWSDAWRCAAQRGLSTIACGCRCHTELNPGVSQVFPRH